MTRGQAREGPRTGCDAWLADRIGGLSDPAGRDPAAPAPAALEPAQAGALPARLHHLVARFRAVLGTAIPPPKPAPKPAEPRFVPTLSLRFAVADLPPADAGLPRSWSWLPRLVPIESNGRPGA